MFRFTPSTTCGHVEVSATVSVKFGDPSYVHAFCRYHSPTRYFYGFTYYLFYYLFYGFNNYLYLLNLKLTNYLLQGDFNYDNKLLVLTMLICRTFVYNMFNVPDQDVIEKLQYPFHK